jgi:hypothetical protein
MKRRVAITLTALLLALVLLPAMQVGTSVAEASCEPGSGCVLRENGVGAWWADSATRGRCRGHSDQDWRVFYRTDNDSWRRADISKIRFGAASWSRVSWAWPVGSSQAQADDIQPPGITLCFGGSRYSLSDVMGTYVRLRP